MNAPLRISVVVPTVGRGSLERCLGALASQTLHPHETVVVRDAEGRGPSWARNEGIRRSTGDLVAFTDDDCIPPPDWLERLSGAMARHGAAAAGGTKAETDPRLRAAASRISFPADEQVDRAGIVRDTANLMVARAALERLIARDGHAFDERMRVAEDVDLAWRIRRRGGVVAWSPVRVEHLRATTSLGYLRHRFRLGWGSAQFERIQRAAAASEDIAPSVEPPPRRSAARKVARLLWHKVLGPLDVFRRAPFPLATVLWLGGKAEAAGTVAGFLLGRIGR
jgi:GT2 family glycosyltransferase